MPRRVIQALCALLLMMTTASPAAGAAVLAPVTGSEPRLQDDVWVDEPIVQDDVWVEGEVWVEDAIVEGEVWVEDAIVEDEFSAFTMPGLTPDNLTDMVLGDIDAFWAGEFASMGRDYYAAGVVPVADVVYSSCGQFGPYDNPAAYCPLETSVYYSVPLGQDIRASIGDYAWITILAHEWGHHVQVLLGIEPELTIDRELQADCLSGAYAQRALQQGFLQEGDITEAVMITILSGDPIEMDEMVEGAHGSSDYRLTSFMEGYFNGAAGCLAY